MPFLFTFNRYIKLLTVFKNYLKYHFIASLLVSTVMIQNKHLRYYKDKQNNFNLNIPHINSLYNSLTINLSNNNYEQKRNSPRQL